MINSFKSAKNKALDALFFNHFKRLSNAIAHVLLIRVMPEYKMISVGSEKL